MQEEKRTRVERTDKELLAMWAKDSKDARNTRNVELEKSFLPENMSASDRRKREAKKREDAKNPPTTIDVVRFIDRSDENRENKPSW